MTENTAVSSGNAQSVVPACSVYEEDEGVVIQLEMPGVQKDAIDIKIEKDDLQVVGTPRHPEENGKYLVGERRKGIFRKHFTIDESIDRDRIEAVMADGVLTIGLRYREMVKPRRIQIKGPSA